MNIPTPLLFLAISFSVLAISSCSSDGHTERAQNQSATRETQKDYYTCPMHPSVISDRPGACPVCGMALVKRTAQQETPEQDAAMLATVSLSPTQRIMANVKTTTVERRSMAREIQTVGVVDYAEPLQALVTARFRGRIERLHVSFTGAVVRKGQPLFDLYSPDLVSTQREFLLALESRAVPSGDSEAATDIHVRLLETARERLRIHYGMTEAQIEDLERSRNVRSSLTFHAPISGTVVQKQIVAGQYVDEGTLAYRLVDLSNVWIMLEVNEKDLRFVRLNQPVKVVTETYPGETFRGRVSFIEPVLNAQTRTMRVRTEFPNPAGKLKPQLYVRATLHAPLGRVLVVPIEAVIRTGMRDVVWVEVRKNQFEPRTVRLGARTDGFYEILDGLKEGEVIVASGGYLIDSESLLAQPSAGGGHVHDGTAQRPTTSTADVPEDRDYAITVHYGYEPDILRVKQGQAVRLLFRRTEDSACTEEVVMKDFGIKKKLPPFATTVIELTPNKKGEFQFSCGMGMLHGTLIVE